MSNSQGRCIHDRILLSVLKMHTIIFIEGPNFCVGVKFYITVVPSFFISFPIKDKVGKTYSGNQYILKDSGATRMVL